MTPSPQPHALGPSYYVQTARDVIEASKDPLADLSEEAVALAHFIVDTHEATDQTSPDQPDVWHVGVGDTLLDENRLQVGAREVVARVDTLQRENQRLREALRNVAQALGEMTPDYVVAALAQEPTP